MVMDDTDVEQLLQMVIAVGQRVQENSKVLDTMSEIVKKVCFNFAHKICDLNKINVGTIFVCRELKRLRPICSVNLTKNCGLTAFYVMFLFLDRWLIGGRRRLKSLASKDAVST